MHFTTALEGLTGLFVFKDQGVDDGGAGDIGGHGLGVMGGNNKAGEEEQAQTDGARRAWSSGKAAKGVAVGGGLFLLLGGAATISRSRDRGAAAPSSSLVPVVPPTAAALSERRRSRLLEAGGSHEGSDEDAGAIHDRGGDTISGQTARDLTDEKNVGHRQLEESDFVCGDSHVLFGDKFESSDSGPDDNLVAITKDWMSHVPDDTLLAVMTIPATHQSGAVGSALKIANCQTWSIKGQLDAGIRSLDIRVKYDFAKYGENTYLGNFQYWHGAWASYNLYLDSTGTDKNDGILDVIKTFLEEHPSETVMVKIVDEKENGDTSTLFKTNLSKLIESHGELFAQDIDDESTLGALRGKILLIRKNYYTSSLDNVGVSAIGGSSCSASDYTNIEQGGGMAKKKAYLNEILDAKEEGGEDCKLSQISVYGTGDDDADTILFMYTPEEVAHSTNSLVYGRIRHYYKPALLGVVKMDYPGESLVYDLIKSNMEQCRQSCKWESFPENPCVPSGEVQWDDKVVLGLHGQSTTGETSNCGWKGCRVAKRSDKRLYLGHGDHDPVQYMVRPDDEEPREKTCVRYGDTVRIVLASDAKSYDTSHSCGNYGCRVMYMDGTQNMKLGHGSNDDTSMTLLPPLVGGSKTYKECIEYGDAFVLVVKEWGPDGDRFCPQYDYGCRCLTYASSDTGLRFDHCKDDRYTTEWNFV